MSRSPARHRSVSYQKSDVNFGSRAYLCSMDNDIDKDWDKVVARLEKQFGEELDMQGILFLVGVQELGQGYRKFKKDEKLNVMHIAICTLLEPYGYYIFEGADADGWPHWKLNEKLPPLKPVQQGVLMKQAIIDYFRNKGLLD
jgi:hypothetical protein